MEPARRGCGRCSRPAPVGGGGVQSARSGSGKFGYTRPDPQGCTQARDCVPIAVRRPVWLSRPRGRQRRRARPGTARRGARTRSRQRAPGCAHHPGGKLSWCDWPAPNPRGRLHSSAVMAWGGGGRRKELRLAEHVAGLIRFGPSSALPRPTSDRFTSRKGSWVLDADAGSAAATATNWSISARGSAWPASIAPNKAPRLMRPPVATQSSRTGILDRRSSSTLLGWCG
jgi:hypothetical protein